MKKSLLVAGMIPAGQPCPFLDNCKFKVHQCPSPSNIRDRDYSCAAARLHDSAQQSEDSAPQHAAMARRIVQKRDKS